MKLTPSTFHRPAAACALAGILTVLFCASLSALTVTADNPDFQYTGRIDFANPQAPFISWPGTSVTAAFTGSELSIVLDDENGANYFNVVIDGNIEYPYVLKCDKGEKTYQVGYGLTNGDHTVTIYKRTEGGEGGTWFRGIELADDATLLPPPPRAPHKIEFFGDSITSGMGDEGADNGPDDNNADKNQFLSYSGAATRALDAEAHVTSQSGIGIMISWFDFTMPDFYDQLSAVGNNDTKWDFSQWTPDVVVVNLFQNDCWLVDREKRLQLMPTEADRIKAYADFVGKIHALYPNAYIVCALGSMDATAKGSKWPGYIESAVKQLRKADASLKIDTYFFDFTGYGQHPRAKQQHDNGERLAAFIREKMGW